MVHQVLQCVQYLAKRRSVRENHHIFLSYSQKEGTMIVGKRIFSGLFTPRKDPAPIDGRHQDMFRPRGKGQKLCIKK